MATVYRSVSWDEYHKNALFLCSRVLNHTPKTEKIVAISRGGLTLGHIFSDCLRIPIWTISIQSYTDIQRQGQLVITGKLQTSIRGRHILLVDDVADSGKTLRRAVSYLSGCKPASITLASMFYKPSSIIKPDYYAQKTKDWIIFPYEPTEMGILLSKKLAKEGKTREDIEKLLRSLRFSEEHIAFLYRYYL